jgi:hypothetical protein
VRRNIVFRVAASAGIVLMSSKSQCRLAGVKLSSQARDSIALVRGKISQIFLTGEIS